MIDTRLLTFINLDRLKNYTRTAEVLHMSQPAVTQHIKFLESYYNIKLFYKHDKEYLVTQEGEILLEYAQKMYSLSDKTQRLLSGTGGIPKKYRLGATLTIGGYLLPEFLAGYKKKKPLTGLSLTVKNTTDTLMDLQRETIDLALIEGEFPKDKFDHKLLKVDELILVASPKNHLSGIKKISLTRLSEEELILREPGSGSRDFLSQKLHDIGVELSDFNISMEVGSLSAIKKLVLSDAGVSIISKEAIKKELVEGTLVHIPIENLTLEREFNFVYCRGLHADDFIDEFIEFCISGF